MLPGHGGLESRWDPRTPFSASPRLSRGTPTPRRWTLVSGLTVMTRLKSFLIALVVYEAENPLAFFAELSCHLDLNPFPFWIVRKSSDSQARTNLWFHELRELAYMSKTLKIGFQGFWHDAVSDMPPQAWGLENIALERAVGLGLMQCGVTGFSICLDFSRGTNSSMASRHQLTLPQVR